MKKLFTLLFSSLVVGGVFAQQSFNNGMYTENEAVISPSNVGIYDYMNVGIQYRSQWRGLTNLSTLPTTLLFQANTALDDNNGIGASFISDKFGIRKTTGLELMYSYRLPINLDYNMSFGLAPKILFFQFDESDVQLIDPNDPTFNLNKINENIFDAKIGVSVYSDDLLLSLSMDNVAQSSLKINEQSPGRNHLRREIAFYGHYRIQPKTNKNLAFEPHLLFRMQIPTKQNQISFGTDVVYRDMFYAGAMLRNKDAFGFRVGIRSREIVLGYQYEFSNSELSSFQNGNHEFALGYRIFNDKSSQNNRWYDRHKEDEWIGKDSILKSKGTDGEEKKKQTKKKKKTPVKKRKPNMSRRRSLG
jgi:type IX secretion system PorP/SprF family membrane protein